VGAPWGFPGEIRLLTAHRVVHNGTFAPFHTLWFTAVPPHWTQDVTLRLIAERLLPQRAVGGTYVEKEMAMRANSVKGRLLFHSINVFCSDNNPGCAGIIEEVNSVLMSQEYRSSHPDGADRIQMVNDIESLSDCAHLIVYLTGETWTGPQSQAFAAEVRQAMEEGVHLQLVYEGVGAGQSDRNAVEFATFFQTTPLDLQTIYDHEVAVTLKGDHWRTTSLVMFADAFTATEPMSPTRRKDPKVTWFQANKKWKAAANRQDEEAGLNDGRSSLSDLAGAFRKRASSLLQGRPSLRRNSKPDAERQNGGNPAMVGLSPKWAAALAVTSSQAGAPPDTYPSAISPPSDDQAGGIQVEFAEDDEIAPADSLGSDPIATVVKKKATRLGSLPDGRPPGK
jgi:hypothetical protein